MSSAVLTHPPSEITRLVIDTDVASFVFKWHPVFAPRYLSLMRGASLVISFMTVAEMREGALVAGWGQRKLDLLENYLGDFSILHSDGPLCARWAAVRSESVRKGRRIGAADAWIAASALILSAPLVTNNPGDFGHLDNLQMIFASG